MTGFCFLEAPGSNGPATLATSVLCLLLLANLHRAVTVPLRIHAMLFVVSIPVVS